VGHAGTLDPKVTGVLVLGIGSATRALDLAREAGKEYVAELVLHRDVELPRLKEAVRAFTGDVLQTPPKRSAVRRRLRTRRVYALEVVEHTPRAALLRVECEAGTYVRTLCHDLGLALGTGAHMGDLRRTRLGPFHESDLVTLHDLRDAVEWSRETGEEVELRRVVRPMEEVLGGIPSVTIRDTAVDAVCHGAPLAVAGVLEADTTVVAGRNAAILTGKGEAVAVGTAQMDAERMVEVREGIAVLPTRVLMAQGTYPRTWGKAADAPPAPTPAPAPE
jgi:H/ACA ribonucleoprotein complex subunit 4